MSVFKKIKVQS